MPAGSRPQALPRVGDAPLLKPAPEPIYFRFKRARGGQRVEVVPVFFSQLDPRIAVQRVPGDEGI